MIKAGGRGMMSLIAGRMIAITSMLMLAYFSQAAEAFHVSRARLILLLEYAIELRDEMPLHTRDAGRLRRRARRESD